MLLNKTAFKHQGFKFTGTDNIIKMVHIPDHPSDFFGMILIRTEILADTVFQSLRLTDIYYFIPAVFHNIDTGLKRQMHRLIPELLNIHVLICLSGNNILVCSCRKTAL